MTSYLQTQMIAQYCFITGFTVNDRNTNADIKINLTYISLFIGHNPTDSNWLCCGNPPFGFWGSLNWRSHLRKPCRHLANSIIADGYETLQNTPYRWGASLLCGCDSVPSTAICLVLTSYTPSRWNLQSFVPPLFSICESASSPWLGPLSTSLLLMMLLESLLGETEASSVSSRGMVHVMSPFVSADFLSSWCINMCFSSAWVLQ